MWWDGILAEWLTSITWNNGIIITSITCNLIWFLFITGFWGSSCLEKMKYREQTFVLIIGWVLSIDQRRLFGKFEDIYNMIHVFKFLNKSFNFNVVAVFFVLLIYFIKPHPSCMAATSGHQEKFPIHICRNKHLIIIIIILLRMGLSITRFIITLLPLCLGILRKSMLRTNDWLFVRLIPSSPRN